MRISLDKRLRATLDQINVRNLADIGCDHGKLAVASLIEGRAEFVYAVDISEKSLQKAKDLAKVAGVSNINFICANGFDGIGDNQIDAAVIAGMGGNEIVSILNNIPKGVDRLVLVAHSDERLLREYLIQHDYAIKKDFCVECKKHFYNIIVAEIGQQQLDLKQLLLGNNAYDSQDYAKYLHYLNHKFENIKNQIDDKAIRMQYQEKLDIIQSEIAQLV